MPISRASFALFILLISIPNRGTETAVMLPPLPPDTSVSAPDGTAIAQQVTSQLYPEESYPVRIRIPSLRVDAPVIEVGVNSAGEMAVPDGATNAVGWYKYGTVPGTMGSAVLDAHVFAAFKRLKSARVGERIYVLDAAGRTHEFKITASAVYPTSDVPMQAIFTKEDGVYLNLITCEGRYVASKGTYSHRRVVYAQMVE